MVLRLSASAADFETAFAALVEARREADEDVSLVVREVIKAVRRDGDIALRAYTRKWDRHDLDRTGWQIDRDDLEKAFRELVPDLRVALELASRRIAAYHEKQLPTDSEALDDAGVRLGARWLPIESAGIYVPGGRAAYPSSVLMNAIPAAVAGVSRVVMMTPMPDGVPNPLVLAAAYLANVDEVRPIGGAQAIAALAYGTETIRRVDVVTGPGNAWVAEAKRQVFGVVGIDMVAGPSEIVIVADGQNDPDWIAADLLSQSEHDPTSQSILITDDAGFADRASAAVLAQLGSLATSAVARLAWENNGAIILVDALEDAVPLIDALAPEHLQIATERPRDLFDRVAHAGSVFLGRLTPEAIGDYVAGPNHVLPTGRRARFSSGLSVLNFMKRTSFIELDDKALREIGRAAVTLAEAEGLPAHAASVARRLNWNSRSWDDAN
ncbi:MAG: histidinol dehydrogenase [Novosphingobium sp. 28-62-57]|uniref:histidinol dehydrogenase n=1 Tax=Novosphingobium sp. 28-62-57 TaxID=1970409 RepID=UPI000BCE6ABB|nr:histidinol dehydrogenase [Novosphingobium sp. 28-62-57]OYZ08663.1 MAG: histidinol dehydrogenase [Novosphingobium sp. 28-62-57]